MPTRHVRQQPLQSAQCCGVHLGLPALSAQPLLQCVLAANNALHLDPCTDSWDAAMLQWSRTPPSSSFMLLKSN